MQNNGLVYNRIQECLSECRRLVDASQLMCNTSTSICEVESRMSEPMQLAIVGRISSSKSTLVNAILGKAEVVRTGHEAETFNVSWLKYGANDAPVNVHLKNGEVLSVERKDWGEWASHQGEQTLKNHVKYIEVTANHEILKYINIIDTPGLDAVSKVDSENTIEFLKTVNPDAVILLFSKSLTEETLRLIKEFQNSETSMSFSINPMNALGVLSKVDTNWDVIKVNDPISDSDSAIKRTLSSRSDVSRSLFRIMPVSALVGLASSTINDEDRRTFEQIAALDDKNITRLFFSTDFFIREYDYLSISSEVRKGLVMKYGLYGSYICVNEIRLNKDVTLKELSQTLREKSGFEAFMKMLMSHFGERAQLIKAQRGMMCLMEACRKDCESADGYEEKILADAVYKRIKSIEEELHELKEWSLLLDIYEGKYDLSEEFTDEFLRISGEYGYSVVSKLGMNEDADISDMLRVAGERRQRWLAEYNSWYKGSSRRAYPYGVICRSYTLLMERMAEQVAEYEEASKKIRIFNKFKYGE